MVLLGGTKRVRNIASLVNSTDRCGRDRKKGMASFSMYYPRIPKGAACARAGCGQGHHVSSDGYSTCPPNGATQVKYSRGTRGGTRLG